MRIVVFLFLTVTLISCGPTETRVVDLPDVLPGDVIEFPGLLMMRDLIRSGEEFITLDGQSNSVFVYSDRGELLRSFGGPGHGPGEMMYPRHVSADESRIVVTGVSGAVHIFTRDGTFDRTITDHPLLTMNGNAFLLDPNRLFIGGLMESSPERTFAHILSLDSGHMTDFFSTSPSGKKYEVRSANNGQCDVDDDLTLWCVQETDYIIFHFDQEGRSLGELSVISPGYRPLNAPYPGPSNMMKMFEWGATWDKIWSVHVLDSHTLLVEYQTSGVGNNWDVVDSSTGRVKTQFRGGPFIDFFDREEGMIYLREPAVEEPVTHVRKILLADLLAMD